MTSSGKLDGTCPGWNGSTEGSAFGGVFLVWLFGRPFGLFFKGFLMGCFGKA